MGLALEPEMFPDVIGEAAYIDAPACVDRDACRRRQRQPKVGAA